MSFLWLLHQSSDTGSLLYVVLYDIFQKLSKQLNNKRFPMKMPISGVARKIRIWPPSAGAEQERAGLQGHRGLIPSRPGGILVFEFESLLYREKVWKFKAEKEGCPWWGC